MASAITPDFSHSADYGQPQKTGTDYGHRITRITARITGATRGGLRALWGSLRILKVTDYGLHPPL